MASGTTCGIIVLCLFLWCCFPHEIDSHRPQHCWSTFKIHRQSKSAKLQPCFDNQCKCDETIVDCSFSNISYIPRMNHSVEFVNMSNNNLRKIMAPGFFVNASRNVSGLDLYNNGLTQIEPGVFRYMFKLKRVFMGGNKLTYDHIAPVLYVPRLKSLELKCGRLGNIPDNFFRNRSCPELRYVDMSWNSIEVLDMEQFQSLDRLMSLYLRSNKITSITPAYLPHLKLWIMHKNKLSAFPTTCDENGTSLYPNVTILDLNSNDISDLSISICLPALSKLSLSYNKFYHFTQNMFSLQTFPVLEQLSLVQMREKIIKVEGFTFNNSHIVDLALAFKPIDFSSDTTISKDVFQGCECMKKLVLGGTNFSGVNHERFQSLFRPVASSLEVLYLGKVGMTRLTEEMFKGFTHLRELYLYENGLRSIPNGLFDHLENLTKLSLGDNQITTISQSTFSEDTQNRLEIIDLSGNPIVCNCDVRLLQRWMRKQRGKFQDRTGYRCSNLNSTIQDFHLPYQACLLNPSTSILISGFIIMVVFFLLVVMVLWNFYWHLYLLFYPFPRRDVHMEAERGHFLFHVFVAYDEDDSGWVHGTLRPMLEDAWGLRACIHMRDFDPGRQELDNISEYLPGSYSILVVFSPSFARDSCRQFELGLCCDQAVKSCCPLVAVCLPGWNTHVTKSMLTVLKLAKTNLEWQEHGEDPHDNRFFWRILHQSLQKAIQRAGEDRRKKRQ